MKKFFNKIADKIFNCRYFKIYDEGWDAGYDAGYNDALEDVEFKFHGLTAYDKKGNKVDLMKILVKMSRKDI